MPHPCVILKMEKQYIMVDVTEKGGTEYWELANWLKDKEFKFTDVDFREPEYDP